MKINEIYYKINNILTGRMKKNTIISVILLILCFIGLVGILSNRMLDVEGLVPYVAKQKIDKVNNTVSIKCEYEFSEFIDKGLVVRTHPAKNKKLNDNQIVKLYISLGKPITIPNLCNRDVQDAKSILNNQGLNISIAELYSEDVEKGKVINTEPTYDSIVSVDENVNILVSRGSEFRKVPEYNNVNILEYEKILNKIDIEYGINYEYSEEIIKDNIIKCDYKVGDRISVQDELGIIVSRGSEYREIPSYQNMSIEDFKEQLEEIDVTYGIDYEYSDKITKGNVIKCDYAEGDIISIQDSLKVVVSNGIGVPVNNIVDSNIEKVKNKFDKYGVKYSIKEEYSNKPIGTVISSNVEGKELIDVDTQVTMTVSKGTVEQEFKNKCEKVSYDTLIRNPTNYKDKKIKLKVKISKIENNSVLGYKYGETVWAKYEGQTIIINDGRELTEPALREGDSVVIYGYGDGTATINVKQKDYQGSLFLGFSYNKTVDSYDVPQIKIKYIEF